MDDESLRCLCTINNESNCLECEIHGKLNCKYNKKLARYFLWNQMPSFIIGFFGLALTSVLIGHWWFFISYPVIIILNFGVLETKFLCSHCPYYADDGRILHCLALDGFPKFWKYNPKPMSKFDKGMMTLIVILLVGIPFSGELYGLYYLFINNYEILTLLGMLGVFIATALTSWQFFYIIDKQYCVFCVNFSCPLNKVPKSIIDQYLRKNPIMKEAWEKSGYQLGE
ncbi:MAG: hypothetical protein ACFFDI_08970 [Promethearchaeota archaeon]